MKAMVFQILTGRAFLNRDQLHLLSTDHSSLGLCLEIRTYKFFQCNHHKETEILPPITMETSRSV